MCHFRFNSPPIGPVGMYITMKEGHKQWELALEKTLGYYLLSGYVVTNREDSITLKVCEFWILVFAFNWG